MKMNTPITPRYSLTTGNIGCARKITKIPTIDKIENEIKDNDNKNRATVLNLMYLYKSNPDVRISILAVVRSR